MQGQNRKTRFGAKRSLLAVVAVVGAIALVPSLVSAHVERASYWPDPGADTSVTPAAGGSIPEIKPLFTALSSSTKAKKKKGKKKKGKKKAGSAKAKKKKKKKQKGAAPGTRTRVVCVQLPPDPPTKQLKKAHRKLHGKALKKRVKQIKDKYANQLSANPSMTMLDASIASAQANGYKLRASQAPISVSATEGQQLHDYNLKLIAACKYMSIQDAVNDSGNNSRVVIMPGTYIEPKSRAKPTNDASCASLRITNDKAQTGAVSYAYQAACPNDQNLIAVIGRGPSSTPVPQPPLTDRHNIPDAGPCIRCNLQIEGSGVKPDDVTIDGGDPAMGDHSPAGADQSHYAKDVGIRIDRADGFVLNNVKVRHFNEHAVYSIETDGFNLNRLKTPFNGEYGVLTFVADHALIHNCDAWGNGDSGIYPGAGADLGDAVPANQRRFGMELRDCDMHHNAGGYSGTDGNSVWVHNNDFYDNTLGFTTDVFTAPGHPGFPQDSDLVENNNFYSNNFNTYLTPCGAGKLPGPNGPNQNCSDVIPTVPVPVGTGMWIAGGNHNTMRNNRFWDNWRRGTMLFAVPDQLVCGPAGIDPAQLPGCNPGAVPPSTSYNNEYYGNIMGITPGGVKDPNGVDFWWDDYLGNTGNCWHNNIGRDGNAASVVTSPDPLPSDCASSTGTTAMGTGNEAELLDCFAAISGGPNMCDWFDTPPEP